MLKILLDECIDHRLGKEIKDCLISTVQQMGWTGLKNGKLLKKAEIEFDVFITSDKNLMFQQNIPKFDISILVLSGKSNRLQDLLPLVPKIRSAISKVKPGKAIIIKS